jgi:hypothetical protein
VPVTIVNRVYTWIIALLLAFLVFLIAAKVGGAEICRPDDESGACQCDCDQAAAVSDPFILQIYNKASYLHRPDEEVPSHLFFTSNLTSRGPPGLFF